MPHSSGGGSRSGGSHGGSHHSGSHHSGGGGSGSSSKISTKSFAGATRYRYTTRSGRNKYYYVSGSPEPAPIPFLIIFGLFILFFLFLTYKNTIKDGLFFPEKLDARSYSSGVSVTDQTGELETGAMEAAMREFLDATGVSPAVEVLYDSAEIGDFTSYAYDRYRELFTDEYHWLLVLALPRDFRTAEKPEWHWEGMIGDECYPAVSYEMEDTFTRIIQKQLRKTTGGNIETGLTNAWAEMARKAPRTQLSFSAAISGGISVVVCTLLMCALLNSYFQPKRLQQAVLDPAEPDTGLFTRSAVCEYCGAKYDPEHDERCPDCGASLR